ncbi:Arm DNA-binding domain-containing protein [Methylocella sp.]|uniref:Arm DNA-binding domain-containing protein n=1 Tax=Methylocella sp. TaxID=1978226 RepID=UPI0037838453
MIIFRLIASDANFQYQGITAHFGYPSGYPEPDEMAKQLTAAAIGKLTPDPNKRIEVSDGLLPALRVVIQPSGAKTFAVRYKFLGQPKKLTLGDATKLTLAEARDLAREALRRTSRR